MKLEQQVTSLEISKRLKNLGVKQESLFKWNWKTNSESKISHTEIVYFPVHLSVNSISAFTVTELGEMLRLNDVCQWLTSNYIKGETGTHNWFIQCGSILPVREGFADTEADARGKCLIYLLENKLITLYE